MDKVVFYDGDCGLCQRSVAAIVKVDSKKELFFAPLNGVTYQSLIGGQSDMSTVVFTLKENSFLRAMPSLKSDAY